MTEDPVKLTVTWVGGVSTSGVFSVPLSTYRSRENPQRWKWEKQQLYDRRQNLVFLTSWHVKSRRGAHLRKGSKCHLSEMSVACCPASVAILRPDTTSQGILRPLTPTLSPSFLAVCAAGMAWATRIPQRTWLTSLRVCKQSRPSLQTCNLTMVTGPSSLPVAVCVHFAHLLLSRSDSLPRASLPPFFVAIMWSP